MVLQADGRSPVSHSSTSTALIAATAPAAGGIYDAPCCEDKSQVTLDHGIVVVGYGEEGGVPFWVLKVGAGFAGQLGMQHVTSTEHVAHVNRTCCARQQNMLQLSVATHLVVCNFTFARGDSLSAGHRLLSHYHQLGDWHGSL
jgi:hypothetical protein